MPLFRPSAALPAFIALAVSALTAPAAFAQAKLSVNMPAPSIKVAKWVKGEPANLVKKGEGFTFKPGTIHVVEFWATWCGPCLTSIPHLTELAEKYKDKVTFTGVSVWERDPAYMEKVSKFVTDMGPKMGYNVAADDKPTDGTMATTWMQAAEQDGIPAAFIVGKDGKIAWIGHPMDMDEPLAQIVAGTFDSAAYARKQEEKQKAMREMQSAFRKVQEHAGKGEFKEAVAVLDTVKSNDPEVQVSLTMTRINLMMEYDQEGAAELARKGVDGPLKDVPMALNNLAWGMVEDGSKWKKPDYDLALKLAEQAVKGTKEKDFTVLDTLALAQYRKGQVDKAIATQEKAVELMKQANGVPEEMVKELNDRLEMFKKAKSGN